MKTHRSTQLFLYCSGGERSVKCVRPALEKEATKEEQRGMVRFLVPRINTQTENELTISQKELEQTESFLYLGSIITKEGRADEDIKHRIKKANGAFMQLYPVWKAKNI